MILASGAILNSPRSLEISPRSKSRLSHRAFDFLFFFSGSGKGRSLLGSSAYTNKHREAKPPVIIICVSLFIFLNTSGTEAAKSEQHASDMKAEPLFFV